MDIRFRLEKRLEQAPAGQKIKYYQAGYDGKRLEQILRLMQICAGRGIDPDPSRERFADYRKRKVYDSVSVRKELQKYDVISFDVFDTLLRRNVSRPAGVFDLLEKKTGIPGFAGCREDAESAARQKLYSRHRSAEVSIEEIYRTMLRAGRDDGRKNRRHMDFCRSDNEREPAVEPWIRRELEMERQCCRADRVVQKLVEMLLADGKRVIAVSDMYLHRPQIRELLQHCGYTALGEIYVSCDYRAGKSDGKLFPVVLQKIGPGKKLVHIGDNFDSDICMQKRLDMDAIHYIYPRTEKFSG